MLMLSLVFASAVSFAKPAAAPPAPGSELIGIWKQVDVTCLEGEADFTSPGRESHAAVQDRRIVYEMTIKKGKAITKVKVWTDLKKKKDFCELDTSEDWEPGENGAIVVSNSKLTRTGHGKDTCSGGYERLEKRTLQTAVAGKELRLTMPQEAREMWSNMEPVEGFCKVSRPILIFEKVEKESGLFKPI